MIPCISNDYYPQFISEIRGKLRGNLANLRIQFFPEKYSQHSVSLIRTKLFIACQT